MGGNVELRICQGVGAARNAGEFAGQGGENGGGIGQLGTVEDEDLMVSAKVHIDLCPRSLLEHLAPERRPPSPDTQPLPAYSSPRIPSRLAQYGFTARSSSCSSVSRSPCRRTATAGPRRLPSAPSTPSAVSHLWAGAIRRW